MARLASVEVTMLVRVTAVVQAETATDAELRCHIAVSAEDVRGAICGVLERHGAEREAGWLDEDRAAFVTAIIDAEPATDTDLRVIA